MMNQHRTNEASEKVSICVLEVEWRSYSEHGEEGMEGGRNRRREAGRNGEREGRREGDWEGDSCIGS